MRLQMTEKFEDVPIIEVTEKTYLNLLESPNLFTIDRYLKSWVMVDREIGMIAKHIVLWNDILHIAPISRMKLI